MKSTIQFVKKYKTVISAIWAILTTILSFYLGFFPIEQNPRLTLYEKSKFDLFAIDEPIEELQIILNGVDLREKKHNLKVFQFKLINNGKSDIRSSDYSDETPFGLRIKNGKMVKIYISKSHRTDAAKGLLKNQYKDSTKIDFNKIFIGKKEYILFELWVEYEQNHNPEVSIKGRIANTTIQSSDKERTKIESIWYELLLPILVVVGIVLALTYLLKFGTLLFKTIKTFLRRLTVIRKYDHHYDRTNKRHRLIAKIYSITGGSVFITTLRQILDYDSLQISYNQELENKKITEDFKDLVKNKKINLGKSETISDYNSPLLDTIELLVEANLVQINKTTDNSFTLEIDSEILSDMKFALRLIDGGDE